MADVYDSWYWSAFWELNEVPILSQWLSEEPPGVVLDAGCGTGRYRKIIEAAGHSYIGIDVSKKMILLSEASLKQTSANQPAQFIVGDMRRTPLPDHSIDTVFCARALTHVEELDEALREFDRVLRKGGAIIISDIHAEHAYLQTTIKMPERTVAIQTFKHTKHDLEQAVAHIGSLRVTRYAEYNLQNLLQKPDIEAFENLYTQPERPIFYVCSLRKV